MGAPRDTERLPYILQVEWREEAGRVLSWGAQRLSQTGTFSKHLACMTVSQPEAQVLSLAPFHR